MARPGPGPPALCPERRGPGGHRLSDGLNYLFDGYRWIVYPPYRRIAADLREKIKTMRSGEQIPSITEITETYQVSRNTALRALKLLRDEGLITVEQGWGSFVK
jgi:hypothetical protein